MSTILNSIRKTLDVDQYWSLDGNAKIHKLLLFTRIYIMMYFQTQQIKHLGNSHQRLRNLQLAPWTHFRNILKSILQNRFYPVIYYCLTYVTYSKIIKPKEHMNTNPFILIILLTIFSWQQYTLLWWIKLMVLYLHHFIQWPSSNLFSFLCERYSFEFHLTFCICLFSLLRPFQPSRISFYTTENMDCN